MYLIDYCVGGLDRKKILLYINRLFILLMLLMPVFFFSGYKIIFQWYLLVLLFIVTILCLIFNIWSYILEWKKEKKV